MPGTTRQSISLRGLPYQRLKNRADFLGKSTAGYLEELIAERMAELRVPPETVLQPKKSRRVTHSDHFTF